MAEQRKPKKKPTQAEAVTIIAGALAIGASAKATATSLSPLLGIPVPILLPILLLAMSKPMTYGIATLPSASASSESQKLEATYRAHYIYTASQRMVQAKRLGKEEQAFAREQTYFNQHLEAVTNRRNASKAVDRAAARYGPELGWYAKMDSITSAECREANGKNFSPTRIPAIGFPGSVHPNCRCRPGRRHATSQTVYSIKTKGRAA